MLASYYDVVHPDRGKGRSIQVHSLDIIWHGPWLVSSGVLAKSGSLLTTLSAAVKRSTTVTHEPDWQPALAAIEPILALTDERVTRIMH